MSFTTPSPPATALFIATKVHPQVHHKRLTLDEFEPCSIVNWRSCVLFVHGDDNRNVPFQQTTDLVEKLRAQSIAFEERIIPDEIHDLLRWSDWLRAYHATAEFFDRKLAAPSERQ